MASFFGIKTWFHKNVSDLSGGQKQLLNLASVMAMQPSVLILDEPTSQLDPIAASDFLAVLGRINRELGTTVILTEHRLEDAFPLAARAAVWTGAACCAPERRPKWAPADGQRGTYVSRHADRHAGVGRGGSAAPCPVTVREGRDWLAGFAANHPLAPLPEEPPPARPAETAVTVEEAWFKYEKDVPDVVKGLSLPWPAGSFWPCWGATAPARPPA